MVLAQLAAGAELQACGPGVPTSVRGNAMQPWPAQYPHETHRAHGEDAATAAVGSLPAGGTFLLTHSPDEHVPVPASSFRRHALSRRLTSRTHDA